MSKINADLKLKCENCGSGKISKQNIYIETPGKMLQLSKQFLHYACKNCGHSFVLNSSNPEFIITKALFN